MLFPNFFYSDQSDVEHLITTSFHIDHIDNYCTEETRLTHNNKRPAIHLGRECVAHPPALYLSRVDQSSCTVHACILIAYTYNTVCIIIYTVYKN